MEFEDLYQRGGLEVHMRIFGRTVTYEAVDSSAGGTEITAWFRPMVGAIDHQNRGIFTVRTADVTNPRRGDKITLNSEEWSVVDARDARPGTYDLRCDRSLDD